MAPRDLFSLSRRVDDPPDPAKEDANVNRRPIQLVDQSGSKRTRLALSVKCDSAWCRRERQIRANARVDRFKPGDFRHSPGLAYIEGIISTGIKNENARFRTLFNQADNGFHLHSFKHDIALGSKHRVYRNQIVNSVNAKPVPGIVHQRYIIRRNSVNETLQYAVEIVLI